MYDRRFSLATAIFFLGYVVLLATVPRIDPDPNGTSAAAILGYDTALAFLVAFAWSAVGLLGFAALRATGFLDPAEPETAAPDSGPGPGALERRVEMGVAFVVFSLAYFPPFLARYAHYIEDNYFLAVLSRMACGQVPFRDFEFLYGPLMIGPVWVWIQLFGLSAKSYFWLLALLEGAVFAVVIGVLQRYLPDRRRRWLAFLLLVPFLFDTLLGMNTIAWRRLPAVFVLLLVAADPRAARKTLAAGVIAGLQIAYSYEFGLVGLGAGLSAQLVMLLGPGRAGVAGGIVRFVGATVATWAIAAFACTGASFADYLSGTATILSQASGAGLGGFVFYWTLDSLALFALLAIAVAAVGRGAFRVFAEAPTEGDRLVLGALAFALVSLKAGLQRADVWHMGAPFLLLVFVLLLPVPRRLFAIGPAMRQAVLALILLGAFAQGVGLLPTGSYFAGGLVRGALDVVAGRPAAGPLASRTWTVESERTTPHAEFVALAAFLAEPAQAARPVLFYGDLWWAGYHAGVCSTGYSFYALLYSDEKAPMRGLLAERPDSLVVLERDVYRRLYEGLEAFDDDPWLSPAKRVGQWLSTVHHHQKSYEREVRHRLWVDALGDTLTSEFSPIARFDEIVVLARDAAGAPPTTVPGSPGDPSS